MFATRRRDANPLAMAAREWKFGVLVKMMAGNFVRYWVPVLTWMLVIFAASTDLMSAEHTSRFLGPFLRWLIPDIPLATIATVQFVVRKTAHVVEYAVLGALLLRATALGGEKAGWTRVALALLLAASWAAIDEFHQSFLASRTGTPKDVMIDTAGALLGLACYARIARWKQRRSFVEA